MPFDFVNRRHYSVDYEKLLDELNCHEFLNDKYVQSEYFKRWIETLMNADKVITEELKTKESILKISLLLESEPEIFQMPMHHKNNDILIHFRVSFTNRIVSEEQKESGGQLIDINEFTDKDASINWTPVEENIDSYANTKEPIIMIPFLTGRYRNLVIDGNHRLTYKVKNNINDIHALIISEQSVIEQSLFSSEFDKLYYIMCNELSRMYDETHSKNTNAIELVQRSYLVDGKLKL